MSASAGEVKGKISFDASGVSRAISQVVSNFGQLEAIVASNWWGLKNVGLAFAALPAAVAAGVGYSIKAAMEWESAMLEVQRTTTGFGPAATEQFKQIEQGLKELASSTPVAISEITKVAAAAGALGVKSEDVVKFTSSVLNLSAMTNLSTDQAAVSLARIAALTGLTAESYDNLASSILKTGQETAATETEITNIATRLAGVAGVVGLTADEVVGLSAALASSGAKSESAGTAMQRTLLMIQSAALTAGPALEGFARMAGLPKEAFQELFRADPAKALVKIVQGLGTLDGGMATASARLKDVGITSTRQTQALLALVRAENQTGNESLKLSNILEKSRDGMLDSQLAANLMAKKSETLAGQISILKNQIVLLGQGFGKYFLPVLKPVVGFFQSFVLAMKSLPGPLKVVLGALLGVVTGISAMAAALLIVGPRIVIAIGSLRKLWKAYTDATLGVKENTAALEENAAAAEAAAVEQGAAGTAAATSAQQFKRVFVQDPVTGKMKGSKMVPVAATEGAVATEATAVGTGAEVAATGLTGFAGAAASLLAPLAALLLAMKAISDVFDLLGKREKSAQDIREKSNIGSKNLVKALDEERKGRLGVVDALSKQEAAAHSVDAILKEEFVHSGLQQAADKMGVGGQLLDVVKGNLPQKEVDAFFQKVKDAAKNGADGTDEFASRVTELNNKFLASVSDANSVQRANSDLTASDEEVAQSMDDMAQSNDKATTAALAYIDAVDGLRDAQKATRDAMDAYRRAVSEAQLNQQKLQEATDKLAQSRREEVDANKKVVDAQKALDHARQDGIDALAEAEDNLASARDKHADLTDRIAEQEKKVAELRAGPVMADLIAATNKLADAQLNVVKSTQQVKDAEWKLQYLREEGASARDIQDAETNVAEAKNNVADATQAQVDAQKDLDRLNDPVQRAKDLAAAERDLASMRRDDAATLRDINKDEQAVNDLRQKVATDQFYIDAQNNLVAAQEAVRAAVLNTLQAEKDLAKLRADTSSQKEVVDAADAVEKAIRNEAAANVEILKQKTLSSGKPWTNKDQAQAMADELTKLLSKAPTPQVRKNLLADIGMNRQIVAQADALQKSIDDLGKYAHDHPVILPVNIDDSKIKGNATRFDEIKKSIREAWDGAWDYIVNYNFDNFWTDVWNGVKKAFSLAWDASSPSRKMVGLGTDAAQGFVNGLFSLPGRISSWGDDAFGNIMSGLGTAGHWLVDTGEKVTVGFAEGMRSVWGNISSAAAEISQFATDAFWDADTWLWDAGQNIILGLLGGVQWGFDNIFKPIWNTVIDSIPGSVADGLKMSSPSKVMMDMGKNVMAGFAIGLSDISAVQRAMGALHDSVSRDMNPYAISALRPTSATTSATSAALAGQIVNNYNFNLETHTGATAPELMNEFLWASSTRLR